jgi:prevent-host-death family protein
MKMIDISEFKANCSSILRNVQRLRLPILVTQYGKPLAEVGPARMKAKRGPRKLGTMKGTGRILGDIVGPTGSE